MASALAYVPFGLDYNLTGVHPVKTMQAIMAWVIPNAIPVSNPRKIDTRSHKSFATEP
jgi:hypothetical protein